MTTIATGGKVPDFRLKAADGSAHSLSEALKKGPVALAFFKVSCPVCQFAWPFLERIHQAYGNDKVSVWGISQDDARDTREYAQEFASTFPMLLDEDGYEVSNAYGITNVPTLILVGADGKARVSGHGFIKKDLETISAQFAAHTGKALAPVFRPGEVIPENKPG